MPKTHTHWPEGKGPVCRFATKRECDEFVRAHNKRAKEEYDLAVAMRIAKERERQHQAQDMFIAAERKRMGFDDGKPFMRIKR